MTTRLGWGKKNYGFVGKQIEKRIYLLESLELNLTFLYVYLILLFNYFFIFFGGQVTMSFRHFFSKRKTRWVSPKQKVCFPKRTTKSCWFPELSRAAPTPFPTQAAGDSPRWPMTWRCLPSPKSSGGFDNSWGSAAGTTHGDAGIDGMEPQAGIMYECFLSLNFYIGLYKFYKHIIYYNIIYLLRLACAKILRRFPRLGRTFQIVPRRSSSLKTLTSGGGKKTVPGVAMDEFLTLW